MTAPVHFCGDCKEQLSNVPDKSVQLIMTSPPYADARKKAYGGVSPDRYVEWFMSRAAELKRVLSEQGTFILNIKERVANGERHTYVIELIRALRAKGWLWTEEWIWHKKNCHPGKWPNRFRDSWERVLQFNLHRKFSMYQDEVMVPVGDWAKSRLSKLNAIDKQRTKSSSGSSFAKNVSNWVDRKKVYPTNVLHLATECGNKQHSAVFPVKLPEFFIKLFTATGDMVLDPFEGSGTTGVAANRLGRNYIGIDLLPKTVECARKRIEQG